MHDRQTKLTRQVNVASDGQGAIGLSGNGGDTPSLSADGRFVAFTSSAPNLAPGDTNVTNDVFVHDLQTGVTRRVSVASNGDQALGQSGPAALSSDGRFVAFLSFNSLELVPGLPPGPSTHVFVRDRNGELPAGVLGAAVLPSSRSMSAGSATTAYATIINSGTAPAIGCHLARMPSFPITLSYQPTDPTTNLPIGNLGMPVDIPGGGAQTFVFSLRTTASFSPCPLPPSICVSQCGGRADHRGVNTVGLCIDGQVPDIVTLAATINGNGIVDIPAVPGTGVFAVATVNLGSGGPIRVSADTNGVSLPVLTTLCQTDPATGNCTGGLTNVVTTTIGAGDTHTFAIFVAAQWLRSVPAWTAPNIRAVLRGEWSDAGLDERGDQDAVERREKEAPEWSD